MLTLPASVRIDVAAEAVDLRRGFEGLAAATRSLIREDPLTGHLFVFLNRRQNRITLLVWDRTGYLLLYKRLERGPSICRRSRRSGSATWSSMRGSWGCCSRAWTCGAPRAGRAGAGYPTGRWRPPSSPGADRPASASPPAAGTGAGHRLAPRPPAICFLTRRRRAGVAVPGTLVEVFLRCGTASCGCHRDPARRHPMGGGYPDTGRLLQRDPGGQCAMRHPTAP